MHLHLNRVSRTDPTRTVGIRRRWISDINRRFTRLKNSIYESIVVNDCFGLKEGKHTIPSLRVAEAAGKRQFAYPRTDRKIKEFMRWLEEEEARGVLEVRRGVSLAGAEESWNDVYIDSAYRQGIRRARSELRKAGKTVPEIDIQTGGVQTAFNQPIHAERVGALFTRTFNELKGITKAMEQRISRELASGLINGLNPKQIADNLINNGVKKIGITRAKAMARTETIRAHHTATIAEYETYELDEVEVKAEWLTAGYNVCEICEGFEGKVFTLQQIKSLIPAHPNCRCVAIPWLGKQHGGTLVGEAIPVKERREWAAHSLKYVQKQEETITSLLATRAGIENARMIGLEYKIKSMDSTVRKIGKELHEHPTWTLRNLETGDANDLLRYTMLVDENKYSKAALNTLKEFKDKGYKIEQVKNYWMTPAEKADYRGINCVVRKNKDVKFELQFHTEQSYDIKENISHPLYEKLRIVGISEKDAHALEQKIIEVWKPCRMPKGFDNVTLQSLLEEKK